MFERRPLASLIEHQVGGGTPSRADRSFWGGNIPWASVKDFTDGSLELKDTEERITEAGLRTSTANLIPAGIPIVCTRMAVGRAAAATMPVAINQDVRALFPKPNVNPRYLLRLLARLQAQAEGQSIGSTVKGIRTADYLALIVPIAPEEEQPKIVQILDTLDTQIRQTEALITKLERIKQGLLTDLLTRGIDQNGQLRPTPDQAPHLYKDSPLGRIPREWRVGSISDYVMEGDGIKPGPFGSSIKKESYTATGFKVYGQEQVISGNQALGAYYIPLSKFSELSDFEVKQGDVLISLVGTIGRVLVIREGFERGIINPRLMRLRPDRRLATPEFLGLLVSSSMFLRKLVAEAGGGTMPVINKKIIQRVRVPIISVTEQERVYENIASLDWRLLHEENERVKLNTSKVGLMDDLLTGRVRVTPLLESAKQARG